MNRASRGRHLKLFFIETLAFSPPLYYSRVIKDIRILSNERLFFWGIRTRGSEISESFLFPDLLTFLWVPKKHKYES
jgi:hypothetical protein